ncbi:TonB-dependent receptor [Phenylobacterium sp.]|uniref:TonB-dependent receptor plug domain-containing protein n=1 Tax=Phenylobacterium sp. TaxID=1871053 RepID=UPI002ED8A6F1
MRYRHLLFAAASAASLLAVETAAAQASDSEVTEVIVTGTRVANRSALQTAAPVDVIGGAELSKAGITEVNQALSVALPSFNFPRPGLADGTDTIRPATLRGLAPDQTLVLVNSKRRHSASLVNINGTIGRGSSAVDMNTIPAAMVQSIEVLRDGASAQYGSDAIAGVINVRLRDAREGGNITATYGERITKVKTLVDAVPAGANYTVDDKKNYSRNDGETINLSGWVGLPLGEAGHVTIAAEFLDQKKTIRTAPDWRRQYSTSGPFDPREATFDRYNAWFGEPDIEQWTLFANGGYDVSDTTRLYGWASYQNRDSTSAGFFRRALDDRNITAIYPDGFLPLINPDVEDLSLAGGVEWKLGEWDMDTSLVYGRNRMEFTIRNTLNRSLGPTSKTVFDAGGFEYDQLVGNISAVRAFDMGLASPLNVAAGVEVRREGYEIFAGEPDSYRNGGVLLPNGTPTASGAQVFPGFRPSNEVDKDRTSVGAYLDLEANLTDKLLASAAVRFEHYSDFGETVTGKVALRYDINDAFAIRGSIQNGFRAPSLQQQYFATTSTNFINGVPFDITTFPATDPVAAALGAQPLDAEESINYAAGVVFRSGAFSLTIDAYRIEVEDRIVLSENLTQANVRDFLTAQGFIGIGGGRFFINGVDTTTKGVDIIANYKVTTDEMGQFALTLGANFNDTNVTKVPATPQLSALNPAPVLFDRINVLTFEEGSPDSKVTGSVDWTMGAWGATVRATRYGKVLVPGTTSALDIELDSAILVDLEARWNVVENVRLTVGADNVFDEYPTKLPPLLNSTSNTPFSNYSPFGRSGRFVYGRVSVNF